MDPDANLMEQIALAKALVYELQAEEGMLTGSEGAALRLAELVLGLNGWLRTGDSRRRPGGRRVDASTS
jgi:hypothetical protein